MVADADASIAAGKYEIDIFSIQQRPEETLSIKERE
jgi:hypothetical protein